MARHNVVAAIRRMSRALSRSLARIVVCSLLLLARGARADTSPGMAEFRAGLFAEAFIQWNAAAEQGDADGALFVGVLYDTGFGVAPDAKLALQWYRRAAEAGSAAGAFNVGVMYDAGRGTVADPVQAASWYARAAARNYPRAEYNLAMLYEAGIGLPRNRLRAAELYGKAARHGISAARARLISLEAPNTLSAHFPSVSTGESHGSDPATAEFDQAQRAFLQRGREGAARAADLLRRAAEQGNALSAYDLGYFYENGIGVVRDPVQAYRWYHRAATGTTDRALLTIARAAEQGLAGVLNQAQLHTP